MKVLISADMEGVCGVTSWTQVTPPEYGGDATSTAEYERARARLTREVNAAVEGALSGGAEEVIVNEAHNGMRNLIPEELHPSVRFITGSDKAFGMMQGVQEAGVGVVFFVGYHAKAGTPGAPLAHTWTGYVNDLRLGGRSTGEFGINAAIAGHFGVPVTLVTGDDKAVAQVQDLLGEQVVGVVVKEGYSTFSAIHLHPERAQTLIREGAQKAVRQVAKAKLFRLLEGCSVEIDFDHQARADQCLYVPGVRRAGERTVAYRAENPLVFNSVFRAVMKASGIRFSP
ncbi:M55 family metallopeptidase [soil metagenome]|jgi:D-amino peptidase|nr:M55 family metallopeptidase [Deinococcota bacterium]